MNKQGFASVLACEIKRVVLKPKRLIFSGVFALVAFLLFMGMTAALDWSAQELASQGITEASDLSTGIPAFLGFDIPLKFLSFSFGIYAAAFAARDYNDGTILATLLCVPNRLRLFFARLLPWVLMAALFSFSAYILISFAGIGRAGGSEAVRILLQALLATVSTVCSVIVGFCCGSITKKGSISVLAFLGLFVIVPMILGMVGGFGPEILQTIIKYIGYAMPGDAFVNMINIVAQEASADTWIACVVTVIWAVGTPALAYFLFKVRGTLGR